MAGFSEVTIVGNLGGDPTLRYTPTGKPVVNLSVAANRKWTGADGQAHDETTWFRVSVWGKQAEACNQYLSKGRQVLVEGRLIPDPKTGGPRLWTGNDGATRASFEVSATQVLFLGNGNGGKAAAAEDEDVPDEEPASDIPF